MHTTDLKISEDLIVGATADLRGSTTISGAATLSDVSKIVFDSQSVAGAGTNQATAANIDLADGRLVFVTGADGTVGVELPALTTAAVGELVIIVNTDASAALEVYPATGDKILPAADNAGITVAASSGLILFKYDATAWIGFEPAAVGA